MSKNQTNSNQPANAADDLRAMLTESMRAYEQVRANRLHARQQADGLLQQETKALQQARSSTQSRLEQTRQQTMILARAEQTRLGDFLAENEAVEASARQLLKSAGLAHIAGAPIQISGEAAPVRRSDEHVNQAFVDAQTAYVDLRASICKLAQAQLDAGEWEDVRRTVEPLLEMGSPLHDLAFELFLESLYKQVQVQISAGTWNMAEKTAAPLLKEKYSPLYDATHKLLYGELLHELKGHDMSVKSVSWSPDGRRVASGSDDDTVRVWDVASGQPIQTLKRNTSYVESVSWSPDGLRVASINSCSYYGGYYDNTVCIWDVASGQRLQQILQENEAYQLNSVSWSPDGGRMASVGYNTMCIWDIASGQSLQTLEEHKNLITSVGWSHDGSEFTSVDDDHTVCVWDVASGQLLQILQIPEEHTSIVNSESQSPDGAKFTSADSDTVRVWDAASDHLLQILKGHTDDVNSVSWSPDGCKLASGSDDNTVCIWEVA